MMGTLRHPALRVALVRVLGGALTLGGVLAGIHILGPAQYGTTVVLMALGLPLAIPATSTERLVLRLAASARKDEAARLVTSFSLYSLIIATLGLAASITLFLLDYPSWLAPLAVATSAIEWTEVTLRQAYFRGVGRLMWGQVPIEVVYPVLSIIGYLAVKPIPTPTQTSFAVIIPNLATTVAILFGPRIGRVVVSKESLLAIQAHWRSISSFLGITLVAALLERGYAISAGTLAGSVQAALFSVGIRTVQVGLFAQALALYYFSPQLAAALAGERNLSPKALSIVRRIRLLSIVPTAPVIALCLASPTWFLSLLGGMRDLRAMLVLCAISIVAQTICGPAQAVLTMSAGEAQVALVYFIGAVVGVGVYCAASGWGAVSALFAVAASYWVFALGQVAFASYRYSHII